MKTSLMIFLFAAAIPANLLIAASPNTDKPTADSASASASAPAPASKPKPARLTLQVAVNVPASLRPWREDDIAEAFADQIGDALWRQGFDGTVVYVNWSNSPRPDLPLLTINLILWQADPIGMVNCTFSAGLSSSLGNKDLGLFSGSSFPMAPRFDAFARSDSFQDAVNQAAGDLYKRATATNLLLPPTSS